MLQNLRVLYSTKGFSAHILFSSGSDPVKQKRYLPSYTGRNRGLERCSGSSVITAVVAGRARRSSHRGIYLYISFFSHFAASPSSLAL